MSILSELFERQTFTAEGKPHGWIQWKGTGVCMDVQCECGLLSHVDAIAMYAVRCPKCGRTYFVNGTVELVPMTEKEVMRWNDEGNIAAVTADNSKCSDF